MSYSRSCLRRRRRALPPRPWLPLCLALALPAAGQEERWSSSGPLCAEVKAIAFAGAESSRVYAATADGSRSLLFASDNNGARWESLPNQPPPAGEILDIEVHPKDDRIVFIAQRGVLKSSNRGRTWKSLGRGLPGLAITRDLKINPVDPKKMFVVADRRLYRTTNGGRRWRLTAPADDVASYVLHPRDPSLVWLSGEQGIFRSTDGGRTWFANDDLRLRDALLAIDPAAPTTVYAASSGFFFRTTDGRRWEYFGSLPGGQKRYLEIGGTDPSEMLLAATAASDRPTLWRSTNGGRSWRSLGLSAVEIQTVARHPGKRKLVLIGARAAVYRSKKGGRGARPVNAGLHGGDTVALATLPPLAPSTQEPVSYAGTMFCGLFVRESGGRSWRPAGGTLERVDQPLAVSPLDPGLLYRGGRRALVISPDGGASWSSVPYDEGGNFTRDLEVSLADPMRVYAAVEYAGLYVSRDGGKSLSLVDRSLLGLTQALTVAAHPTAVGVLLVGGQGGLARSTDGGATWSGVLADSVSEVTFDPLAPENVFALGVEETLLTSRDAGVSWSSTPLDLPPRTDLQAVLADGLNPGTVYLATSVGLLRSTDSGRTWAFFDRGLPDPLPAFSIRSTHLALTAAGELLLATRGGVYSVPVR